MCLCAGVRSGCCSYCHLIVKEARAAHCPSSASTDTLSSSVCSQIWCWRSRASVPVLKVFPPVPPLHAQSRSSSTRLPVVHVSLALQLCVVCACGCVCTHRRPHIGPRRGCPNAHQTSTGQRIACNALLHNTMQWQRHVQTRSKGKRQRCCECVCACSASLSRQQQPCDSTHRDAARSGNSHFLSDLPCNRDCDSCTVTAPQPLVSARALGCTTWRAWVQKAP